MLRTLRDLAIRKNNEDLVQTLFNAPKVLVDWVLELTEEELEEYVEYFQVPVYQCSLQKDKAWEQIVSELRKPKKQIRRDKVSLLLANTTRG